MAAPTKAHCIKKTLANGEPSTHGAKRTCRLRLANPLIGVIQTFAGIGLLVVVTA
jgi:hypothetical protein